MDMLQIGDLAEKQVLLNFDDYQLSHINLVQGDTLSRPFVIQVIGANGEFYRSNPDIQCRLIGVNSNYPEKTLISIGTTFGDAYKVYVTTDMVSRAGILSLQIGLYDGDTALIQSDVLDVDVNDSLMTGARIGGDGVLDFMELQAAIVSSKVLEENYTKSLDEQKEIYADINEKHEHTIKLEAELSDILETEQSRVVAEDKREDDEGQRKKNEAARLANEKQRIEDENKRIADEQARVEAEEIRNSSDTEQLRQSNEKERIANEIKREAGEDERVTAEEERKAIFETWDTTMSEIIPDATDESPGIVKVDSIEGEETPHKVPTVGKLEEDMTGLSSAISSTEEYLTNKIKEAIDKIPPINDATESEQGLVKVESVENEVAPFTVMSKATVNEQMTALENYISEVADGLERLEHSLLSDVTGNPFEISFKDLDGLIVTGVWNKEKQRIEI